MLGKIFVEAVLALPAEIVIKHSVDHLLYYLEGETMEIQDPNKKIDLRKAIFLFNNPLFVLRTLMVPSTKDDGFIGDYYKYKDKTFQIRIGQLLFYTKK